MVTKVAYREVLTKAQRSALTYIGDCRRFPPKARLSTWKSLLDAGLIQGPRFACYATPVGWDFRPQRPRVVPMALTYLAAVAIFVLPLIAWCVL